MSNEELMRPRYKVIADYFYNPYKTGDIITVMYGDRSVHLTTTHCRDEFGEMVNQHNYFHPNRLDDFPHLFKKLEWWEEMEPGQMPEYVKHEQHGWIDKHIGINHAGDSFVFIGRNDTIEWEFKYFTPATAAEYEQYINQQKQTNDADKI